eukprot:GHVQ01009507.1.p1 GENE.GHVQ01009507.1~~GHVQ01009507.1.p1  ORF type:complete len:723 (-),score=172.58 GHVQ01009507.1:732-2900(-)
MTDNAEERAERGDEDDEEEEEPEEEEAEEDEEEEDVTVIQYPTNLRYLSSIPPSLPPTPLTLTPPPTPTPSLPLSLSSPHARHLLIHSPAFSFIILCSVAVSSIGPSNLGSAICDCVSVAREAELMLSGVWAGGGELGAAVDDMLMNAGMRHSLGGGGGGVEGSVGDVLNMSWGLQELGVRGGGGVGGLGGMGLGVGGSVVTDGFCHFLNYVMMTSACDAGPTCDLPIEPREPSFHTVDLSTLPLEQLVNQHPSSTSNEKLPTYIPKSTWEKEGPTYHALWRSILNVYDAHQLKTCNGGGVEYDRGDGGWLLPGWVIAMSIESLPEGAPAQNARPFAVLGTNGHTLLIVIRGTVSSFEWAIDFQLGLVSETYPTARAGHGQIDIVPVGGNTAETSQKDTQTVRTTTATTRQAATTPTVPVAAGAPFVDVGGAIEWGGGRVHRGISKFIPPLLSKIRGFLKEHPQYDRIVITGHSLGGGVATLLGYQLANPPPSAVGAFRGRVDVVSFATPGKLGDDVFTLQLSKTVNLRAVRFELDMFVTVPCKELDKCNKYQAIVPTTDTVRRTVGHSNTNTSVNSNNIFNSRSSSTTNSSSVRSSSNTNNSASGRGRESDLIPWRYAAIPGIVQFGIADLPVESLWRAPPSSPSSSPPSSPTQTLTPPPAPTPVSLSIWENHDCSYTCWLATTFAPHDRFTMCNSGQRNVGERAPDDVCVIFVGGGRSIV